MAGRVDVVREGEGLKIAVEVSLENKLSDEIANVRKCLSAGFEHICLVTPSAKRNERLAHSLKQQFPTDELAKVQILLPDEFFLFLETFPRPQPSQETIVRGYRVLVIKRPLAKEEQEKRYSQLQALI